MGIYQQSSLFLSGFAPLPGKWISTTSLCYLLVSGHFSNVIIIVLFIGDVVFVHGAAATPLPLLDSLAAHGKASQLKDVQLIHIHTEGPGVCQQPEYNGIPTVSS